MTVKWPVRVNEKVDPIWRDIISTWVNSDDYGNMILEDYIAHKYPLVKRIYKTDAWITYLGFDSEQDLCWFMLENS